MRHFKEHDMKLSSLSFSDHESIPERYAFGKIDAQSHVALADNYNPCLLYTSDAADE